MNVFTGQDLLNRIIWIRGIPPVDFWVRREDLMREIIDKSKATPIQLAKYQYEAAAGVAQPAMAEAPTEQAALPVRRPPFPGGMRTAHLHFEGNVYALDEQQWRAFAGAVIKGLSEKLAKASELSFDQVRDIAESIDKLG